MSELITTPEPDTQQGLRRFCADLRAVYRKIVINNDPKECLPILGERFEARKVAIRNRRQPFVADLKKVFEKVAVDPKRHIPLLADRFVAWREETVRELARHVAELPKDDPLFSAISLFGTMDLGRLERAHTKVLAWFLDPMKEHEFGSLLLHRLVRHLEDSENASKVDVEAVESETVIADDKRLDVLVEGKSTDAAGKTSPWLMVIEAKVDAAEGEDQLAAYDEWIDQEWIPKKGDGATAARIFLTPDGREAETSKQWKALSFLELACMFRGALLELQDKAGYHFLRHYLTGILKDVCRWNLPIRQPENSADPYGFLRYVKSVRHGRTKGEKL